MCNKIENDIIFDSALMEKWKLNVYDIEEKPFRIYGIYKPEGETEFIRMPRDVAEHVNSGIRDTLNAQTSGGRIRFKTDSACIALKCYYPNLNLFPHMPLTCSMGFDLYADGEYIKTCNSDFHAVKFFSGQLMEAWNEPVMYENIVEFPDRKLRDIIIYFPLYNAVNKVFIGLEEGAVLKEGNEYACKMPFVAYGSSITQGACASRPGNLYTNILSRRLDTDFISLGFNGSAKAEEAMIEYIAGLEMSAFIYDYDHNAPDAEYLRDTHYKMYKRIRDTHPGRPVIMLSRPNLYEDYEKRVEVIQQTLTRALEEGDSSIYFVNGQDAINYYDHNMVTVDGIHPNDFGMFCIEQAVEKILKEVL